MKQKKKKYKPKSRNALLEKLKKYPQWVLWKNIDGRKIPVNSRTGENASVTNPATWSEWNDKIGHEPMKGFVLADSDPHTVIDLDHCFIDKAPGERILNKQATRIVLFFQSYTEISPSRNGVHIWMEGSVPAAIKKTEFEVYTTKRYMTVTASPIFNYFVTNRQLQLDKLFAKYGKVIEDCIDIDDVQSHGCEEELRQLYRCSSYLKQIWNFELGFMKAEGVPDYSRYDMALAGLLRDWPTEKVVFAIDFFRQQHNLKPKHRKAVLMTIERARLS